MPLPTRTRSPITDAQLAVLRAMVETILPDTAQIQRMTQVVDDRGNTTDTYAPTSTVACHVTRSGNQPDERIVAERIVGRSAFTLYLPHDADVRESDRIVVASLGQTYEVIGVLAPTSYQVHVRAVCAREG